MIATVPRSPAPLVAGRSLPSLTGLRWLAAVTVFFYHLRNVGYFGGLEQHVLSALVGGGASAVSLFFVLSGFVLAWSDRPGTSLRESWTNRIIRVYPLHLLGVVLAVLVAATVYPGIRTDSGSALMANLLLVNTWRGDWWQAGNPVSWSLSNEMFFYLLFPFVVRLLRGRRRATVAGVAVVSLVCTWIAPLLAAYLAPSISAYSNPVVRLPEFVLGVAAALLMRSHRWRGPALPVAVVTIGAGYVASTSMPGSPLSAAGFTSAGSVLLICALARRDIERSGSWLATPVMTRLGHASFAFYVVHLLVLQSVQGLFPVLRAADPVTALAGAGAAFVVALALGSILHLMVERPLARVLRAKHRPQGAHVPESNRRTTSVHPVAV